MWDEMRMKTACFARAPQRCTSRLSKRFSLIFQEDAPLSKTRNQLRVKNWVLKTEVNGTSREGENARLPAMTAMLILGHVT
jgi:hypothetical protein